MDVKVKSSVIDISAMPPETKKISFETDTELVDNVLATVMYLRCYDQDGNKIAIGKYYNNYDNDPRGTQVNFKKQ